ncbi:MAG TPA: A24 family peptidase, partial [Candidatus Dormibacteraeota bacterium]|nr:A24 family peptidase [Candidatus Dormibacteraeota bacterium]
MSESIIGLAVAAAIAAVVGIPAGMVTHRLNQRFIAVEEDATEPPLPAEPYWAPVLDVVLLAWLFFRHGPRVYTVVAAVVVIILVQVLVFDARHRLILNRVMYPAIVVALLISPITPILVGTLPARLLAAVGGASVAGGVFFLMSVITRGGVGMGDAKLSFFMGAVLGGLPLPVPPVMEALIWGMLGGGVIAGL